MKKICVTYHMERVNETAESCVDVPVEQSRLEGLLVHGTDFPDWLEDVDNATATAVYAVWSIVSELACLQGYNKAWVVDVRLAEVTM